MEIESENRFLGIIENSIKKNWDLPALSDYNGEVFYYRDFARKIAELHILFDVLGIQQGDKIALCGRNSSHWAVVFFGTLSYGAVVTTILQDFNAENVHNIVNHSDVKVLFAGEHVWEKLDPKEMPALETIFILDDFSVIKSRSHDLIHTAGSLELTMSQKYPSGFKKENLQFHIENPEDLAVLNYTSGTTSSPKGVMLPYRSLWSNTRFAIDRIPFLNPGDGSVCMLPMAHMYGLAFEILLPISKGCHIHFLTRVPSPQVITTAFSKVKPKLILAVPLIIEKIIRNKVFVELDKQPTKTLLKLPVVKNIIYKKVLDQLIQTFGGNLIQVVIGGAALSPEVGNFLTKIGFPYTIGYGMTECGPLVSYAYWETFKSGSCGRIVDRMEIEIDSSDAATVPGEIFVRGMNVMLGYYKNDEATKETFTEDGWLKTGDLGIIDEEGNIYLKGRNKTLILGASGQNIYPEEIESLLNNYPYVEESLIVDREGKLVALIFASEDQLKTTHTDRAKLDSIFTNTLTAINKRLPGYSQISHFEIVNQEFEKTPKRSIRRFLYK